MSNRFFPSYNTYKITSKYGMRTINGKDSMHNGIDLVASNTGKESCTDKITSHSDGKVISCGYDKSAGYFANIGTDSKNYMCYFHMKQGSLAVKTGDVVKKGQVIGYMGNTGNSFGAHLHWGIKENGSWIDPTPFLDKDYTQKEVVVMTVDIEMNVLQYGAKGEQVKTLQRLLNVLIDAGLEVDGSFGNATLTAVKAYQKANGLVVDGSVGKATWTSLLK
jgi:hypothetical protein